MFNPLARYGIKEVADVTFYELGENGKPTKPVLFLDTLKVSTIEQTGEEAEARGGKGNGVLIAWDYNKEINVTLEDALFSAKSMAIMFGDGVVKDYSYNSAGNTQPYIMKTEQFNIDLTDTTNYGWSSNFEGPDGYNYQKLNAKFFTATGDTLSSKGALSTLESGQPVFCSYDLAVNGCVIEVSANSFPGTYYVTGDTFARSEASGKDEFFQFIIPKAKVTSENTITLEADGDPSVFNMNLKVLRPADGCMMKLVKYGLVNPGEKTTVAPSELYHNHVLLPEGAGTTPTEATWPTEANS